MESLLRVPEVPSGSWKALKGRKTPTDKHERRAADPAAWRTIMAQLHGRRVEVDAMKPMQHIPAVKPSCASSPTPPPTIPITSGLSHTHAHQHAAHTLLQLGASSDSAVRSAAPRRSPLPFLFLPPSAALTHYQRDGPVVPVDLQPTGHHLLPMAPAAGLRRRR